MATTIAVAEEDYHAKLELAGRAARHDVDDAMVSGRRPSHRRRRQRRLDAELADLQDALRIGPAARARTSSAGSSQARSRSASNCRAAQPPHQWMKPEDCFDQHVESRQ